MKRHDWTCEPYQTPYGVRWVCTCGASEVTSLVVLSDPERLRSLATSLSSPCSGVRRPPRP